MASTASPPPVHVRVPVTCASYQPDHNGECLDCDDLADAHDPATTYCGACDGESLSLAFWLEHVVPHRMGCCAKLYARLCSDCDQFIPFTIDGQPRTPGGASHA